MAYRIFLPWLLTSSCGEGPTPCTPGDPVEVHRSAGCAVLQDNRLLLVKNSSGWTFPGGYREADETSAQTAVRETREEASILVQAGPRYCAVSAKAFVLHTCQWDGAGSARPDQVETTDVRFFSAAEVRALADADLRFPDQRPAMLSILGDARAVP